MLCFSFLFVCLLCFFVIVFWVFLIDWLVGFCFLFYCPWGWRSERLNYFFWTSQNISEVFVIRSSIVVCFLWIFLMRTLTCCNHTAPAGGYGTMPIRLCSFPTTVCYVFKVYRFLKMYGYNWTLHGHAYTSLCPHSTGWWNSGSEITFRHLQTSCTSTNKPMLLQLSCFWHCK